jgi:threonine dehydratase
MAPMPGAIPFEIARRHLTGVLVVTDAELERAVSYAAQRLRLIVEPGGAAALAAPLAGKFAVKGRIVAIVLTGGNCDIANVARCCAAYPDP